MPLRDILTIRTFWEIASRFCVVLLLELACLKGDDDDVDCRAVARKDGHEDGGCGLLHCGSQRRTERKKLGG